MGRRRSRRRAGRATRRYLVVAAVVALVAGLSSAGTVPAPPRPLLTAAETGSTFTPMSPVRVLDTRRGTGTNGSVRPVGPNQAITLNLSAAVPADATAVVFNLTGTAPTAATYVTAYPTGTARPLASNLQLEVNDTRALLVTVALGTNRSVQLYNYLGNVHLVADLAGFYAPGPGSKYTSLSPTRVLDTRLADDIPALGPGATQVVDLSAHVPPTATSVSFNLTGVLPSLGTYLIAWPTGQARPGVSNLNFFAGDIRSNMVTVPLGTDRTVSLYNLVGQIDVLVDITGFYTPEYGATFVPVAPVRVLDTRTGTGTTAAGPIRGGTAVPVHPGPAVPANATAALLNLTAVNATAHTYVSLWSPDGRANGVASTFNPGPKELVANLSSVALSTMESIAAYNYTGRVDVIADLAGVFVAPTAGCVLDCAYTWGGNESWVLGTGQRVPNSATAAQVVGLAGVTALAGGHGGARYALRSDGTVWSWGPAVFGQLGADWNAIGWSAVPVPVAGLTDVTAIAAGQYQALALRADGTVWTWGANLDSTLGAGVGPVSDVPVRVAGLTGVTAIAAGDSTGYALRADGTVWAWGGNTNGALGDGSLAEFAETPVQVAGLTGVTAIGAGGHSGYAIVDGALWSWGSNRAGELGTGGGCGPANPAGCLSRVPVRVTGLTEVTSVVASPFTGAGGTAYALRADGTTWAWGSNERGALGTGSTGAGSPVPVQVTGLADIVDLAAGVDTGYALAADGTVWAWGENSAGELGTGDCGSGDCFVAAPVQVPGVPVATSVAPGGVVVPNP